MNQADLFATAAENRRDLGIARAQMKAERECGNDWTQRAAEYLRDYAKRTHGQAFLIEDAVEVCKLPKPSNARAWGVATQFAARRRWIVKAGSAPARTSNLAPKWTWRQGVVP